MLRRHASHRLTQAAEIGPQVGEITPDPGRDLDLAFEEFRIDLTAGQAFAFAQHRRTPPDGKIAAPSLDQQLSLRDPTGATGGTPHPGSRPLGPSAGTRPAHTE